MLFIISLNNYSAKIKTINMLRERNITRNTFQINMNVDTFKGDILAPMQHQYFPILICFIFTKMSHSGI